MATKVGLSTILPISYFSTMVVILLASRLLDFPRTVLIFLLSFLTLLLNLVSVVIIQNLKQENTEARLLLRYLISENDIWCERMFGIWWLGRVIVWLCVALFIFWRGDVTGALIFVVVWGAIICAPLVARI